jgi:hypothetical protein
MVANDWRTIAASLNLVAVGTADIRLLLTTRTVI